MMGVLSRLWMSMIIVGAGCGTAELADLDGGRGPTVEEALARQHLFGPTFVETSGLRIATYRSFGRRTPCVVLLHGNSSSSKSYLFQLLGGLGWRRCVVAIDLPGHGASDDALAPDETYTPLGYVHIIRDVVTQIGIEDSVFVGWSLGGNILLEGATMFSDARGYLIFGAPPVGLPLSGQEFLPDSAVNLGFLRHLTKEQQRTYVESFFRPDVPCIPRFFFDDVARTDGSAREILGISVALGHYRDQVEVVGALETPIAILHGREEQLVSLEYIESLSIPALWRGAVVVIDGAGHALHWERPILFNRLVRTFVRSLD